MTKATYKPAITKDTPYPKIQLPCELSCCNSEGSREEEEEDSDEEGYCTENESEEDILEEYDPKDELKIMQAIIAVKSGELEDLTPEKNFLSDPEKHFSALIKAHFENYKLGTRERVSCDNFAEYFTGIFTNYHDEGEKLFGYKYKRCFDPEFYFRLDEEDRGKYSEKDYN